MNEYKFIVEREFTGVVKDIYTVVAVSKEEAVKEFKEIFQSPADMAMLPHDTVIENDDFNYNENALVTMQYKDKYLPFETVEQVDLES